MFGYRALLLILSATSMADHFRLNFANPLHYAVRGKRVLEDAACDLIDLVDCSEYEKEESICLNTVNGYVCCICIEEVDEEQLKESLKSGKGSKASWTWNKAEREAFIAKWTKKEMRRAWDPYTDSLHH